MFSPTKLLSAIILLNGAAAYAAKSASMQLTVTIRPAVTLTLQGAGVVGVKIRLAPETQARIWKSETCAGMPAGGYVVSQSGIYSVPLTALEGQGGRICLASTDGSLATGIPLPPVAP